MNNRTNPTEVTIIDKIGYITRQVLAPFSQETVIKNIIEPLDITDYTIKTSGLDCHACVVQVRDLNDEGILSVLGSSDNYIFGLEEPRICSTLNDLKWFIEEYPTDVSFHVSLSDKIICGEIEVSFCKEQSVVKIIGSTKGFP